MPQRSIRFYKFIRSVLFSFYKVFFGFKCYGFDRVPSPEDNRGVILAPNHSSFLDPPVLGISLKRPVTYLAKEYLFRAFFIGFVLRKVGAFPILTRTDDFRSIRGLLRILSQGECIVVFPEGTRSPQGEFQEPEPGLGFLAIKSKAWVVPVYIEGTYEAFPRHAKFFKPHPVKVYYGVPFIPALDAAVLASPDPYGAVGQKVMAQIQRLKEER